MGIYRRVYCPDCKKDFEIRDNRRNTDCKHCGVAIKLDDKNAIFYIEYSHNSQRKREKVGFNKQLAENVLKKRLVEIAENKFLDIKKEEKTKFSDFSDEYLEGHLRVNCSKGWARKELVNINRLKQFFTGKYLHEITPQLIEKFKADRLKEVSPSTVNKGLSCLRSIFNKAIDWGRFQGKNPVSKVGLLKVDNKRLRYLEKEEIPILLNNCSTHIKPLVIVALNTGMRKSELFNLKWQDIDCKRDTIQLLKTKNNKPRHIPMNELVKTTLIAVRKHPESPYVFTNRQGKPFVDIKRSFTTALKKSGIKDFRFHDLRHTFASQLVMNGVDLNTVRELLGHSSLEMTLRYAHLSPSHKKRAVDSLLDRIATDMPRKKNINELTNLELDTYKEELVGS
ncbi:MAG: hypothetical protein FJZ16_00920 [Candidatus Omnitrophica bacterium]|nr:hypothetical protein [Candidatus Omnitrophota bacterium]